MKNDDNGAVGDSIIEVPLPVGGRGEIKIFNTDSPGSIGMNAECKPVWFILRPAENQSVKIGGAVLTGAEKEEVDREILSVVGGAKIDFEQTKTASYLGTVTLPQYTVSPGGHAPVKSYKVVHYFLLQDKPLVTMSDGRGLQALLDLSGGKLAKSKK